MKKFLISLFFVVVATNTFAQEERYPEFSSCEKVSLFDKEDCFYNKIQELFFKSFKTPKQLVDRNFKGIVNVKFVVTVEGKFKPVFISTPDQSIIKEVTKVLNNFPRVKPAIKNNKQVERTFILPVVFPLKENARNNVLAEVTDKKGVTSPVEVAVSEEVSNKVKGISTLERFPKFSDCKNVAIQNEESCFYAETKKHFFDEFKEIEELRRNNYRGNVNVDFIVTKEGKFKVVFVSLQNEKLKNEVIRVFNTFPNVEPGKYDGRNFEKKFVMPIIFPVEYNTINTTYQNVQKLSLAKAVKEQQRIADSTFLKYNSQLNIPFVHQKYVDYDLAMHQNVGTHTAVKPYTYNQVRKYYDFKKEKQQFLKPEKKSWWGRKLWNEHLLQVKKEDYWITADFLFDLQLGKDNSETVSYTFNNTRLLNVNVGIGDKFSATATVYESQGRFAEYINKYNSNPSSTFKPAFSEGLVPGRGKAKGFKKDAYDYPVAEGYLSYKPNKFFQFQFGHGKNFIGDGYRSLLLSDNSSPSPYLKMDVEIWKFKYTNLWLWGRDVRANAVINNEHARKYVAIHYFSVNLSDKLNLGFFETAISEGSQGFDVGFLNPIMFYRAVEFNRGEDSGNAMVGLTAKYKLTNETMLYSQLIIDEFSIGNLGNLNDWRNKFGVQLGAKVFNAFDVKNLYLQGEFNYARPYTFAHKNPVLNYAHYSQPLGHTWGANFWEFIGITRYKKDRWNGYAKLILGKKGYDKGDGVSYGGDLYQSYNDRYSDTANKLAQGNTANIFFAEVQANYLLNPASGLSLFTGLTFRNFSPKTTTPTFIKDTNVWFTAGLKADLFNWYLDF